MAEIVIHGRFKNARANLAGVCCVLYVVAPLLTHTSVDAATETRPAHSLRSAPSYCGIYAVYGALKSVGLDCQFRDLVRSEYVTSRFGSKLDDLKMAAQTHGAFTEAWANMTCADLEDAQCPVVLHVADERRIGIYNHWVLYLGTENGLARIVDAPHELELIPFADLLARWDSVGLLISEKPIDLSPFRVRHWLSTSLVVTIAAALGAFGWRRRPTGRRVRGPMQVMAIMGLAAAGALGFHALGGIGMLHNSMAVQLVQQSHLPISLPELSAAKLAELIAKNDAIVVDARFEQAFERGHIPGAINIPLTASRLERRRLLDGAAKGKQLIVYCESAQCSYAEHVGRSLVIDGYDKVCLYPEGWRTWSSTNKAE